MVSDINKNRINELVIVQIVDGKYYVTFLEPMLKSEKPAFETTISLSVIYPRVVMFNEEYPFDIYIRNIGSRDAENVVVIINMTGLSGQYKWYIGTIKPNVGYRTIWRIRATSAFIKFTIIVDSLNAPKIVRHGFIRVERFRADSSSTFLR